MEMTSPYWLSAGSHDSVADGRCAMEWVAYIAGEPHSASPLCVADDLRGLAIALNDRMTAPERQRLRPYLARMIGTTVFKVDARGEERLIPSQAVAQERRAVLLTNFAVGLLGGDGQAGTYEEALELADRAAHRIGERPLEYATSSLFIALYDRDFESIGEAAASVWLEGEEHDVAMLLRLLDELLPGEMIEMPADARERAREVCAV